MPRPNRSLKSSPSRSGVRWLNSVMRAYAALGRQWSAFSTMIRSAPQAGYEVSLAPSVAPKLSVSPVPLSSPASGGGIGTYLSFPGFTTYTNGPSSMTTNIQDTSVPAAPPPPPRPRRGVPMKARSTSLKRATCRSAPRPSAP